MPIQFRCTTCNKLLSIARRKGGQNIECPVCGAFIRVPEEIQPTKFGESPSKPAPRVYDPPNQTHPEPKSPVPQAPVSTETFHTPVPIPPQPIVTETPFSEPEHPQFQESTGPAKPKPVPSSSAKSQRTASSILELDPDTIFGSSRASLPKFSSQTAQPGILDEMHIEIPGSDSLNEDLFGEEKSTPELVVEQPISPSWKLILFGTLMTIGMIVAAFLAWKLVFSNPT